MEDDFELEEFSIADYEKQKEAIDKAKRVLKKVTKARNFVSKRDGQLQENMAFYQGNPYLLAQYSETRPWVIQMNTPYAAMAIDTRTASLSASDYTGKLQPYTPEDTDTVQALESVYKAEWERANMDALIDDAINTSAVVREAYIHLVLDTSKKRGGRVGEITAYKLDTTSVLLDPRARSFNDVQYIIVLGRITKEELEEDYSEYIKFFDKKTSIMPEDRGELYIDNDYTTEQEDVYTIYTMYEKEKGKIYKRVVVEGLCVEEQELKGIKRLPIAQLPWKKAAQSAYGFSLMDDILSLQKAISAIESAITNTAVAYSSPAMVVRKGSGINPKVVAKTIGAPGVVYVSDIPISEAMQPVIPAKIDDKIVSLKTDFENTIDKIAGVTNQFIGNIGTAGNTAQGSQLAVERAKIVETSVLSNIAEFVEQLTMIFIDYITTAYSGEMITNRKLNQTTGQYEFSNQYVPNEIKDVEFSFYVDLEVKTKYSKEREKESLLQLYQMERQYDSPIKLINELDILARYDLTNVDELRERYARMSQQTVDNKTQTIMNLTQVAQKFNIPQELLSQAIKEVIDGAQETPALDQFMQAAQQMSTQVQSEAQMAKDDLAAQGIDPQYLTQAEQMLTEQGQGADVNNLGLT